MQFKFLQYLGLLGAVLSGGVLIAKGDINTGIGVIASSLSSAGILTKQPG